MWPYSCCYEECCFEDLLKTADGILVNFPSNFFSKRFVKVYMVQPYISTDTATALKNSSFVLLGRSDFHMLVGLSIAVYALSMCMLTFLLVDEMLLSRYINWSTNFKSLTINEIAPSQLKNLNSVLSELMSRPMPPAACSRLYSWDSARASVFIRSAWHTRIKELWINTFR